MFTQVVPPESPCGCESGRPFGECCLRDGGIKLRPKKISPPRPKSGFQLNRCWLAHTSDCDERISGDHIISASVLREIADTDTLTIAGSKFTRSFKIEGDSLKVNRLCRRHNSALSPLDAEAARLFRAVQKCNKALAGQSSSAMKLFLFHGFDVERWLAKTLLGTFYGKLSKVAPPDYRMPNHVLRLFYGMLAKPFGLYVPSERAAGGRPRKTVVGRHAAINLITEAKTVAGIQVSMGGLEVRLIVGGGPVAIAEESVRSVHRPKFLNFFEGHDVFTLGLAWPEDSNRAVWYSRGRNARIPTDP